MAVYQGVRLRSTALPATRATQVVRRAARTATPATTSARPAWRPRPAAALLAVILAGTLVALLYLTQTLATNALSVEIAQLGADIRELERQWQTNQVYVRTESAVSEVIDWAGDHGLTELRQPIRLPAP
jgi:hypothetical protein